MPWTLGLIDRFLDAHVRTRAITKPIADEIRGRAHARFSGEENKAISGRFGLEIFEGHESLFDELVRGFGQFMTEADLIAMGKKANARGRKGRHHA